ncbi:hypothetical protein EIN_331230 [Entamoeba invadens IP1]|uniref:Leucine rich repeat containing protein BspA family protein n=1 Tax=Entamoeba invadens IP1 TaxID=370355 RepID=A0A0A1TWX3_ENTIV|nr:hypothetical protein EIN_331230 [Entamoeba invadens IP1]ELP85722.1 hypothetical protein EIN_331230 [Entamoeba invadens IP1]|eukprot:XP_004185068.1 hypothetical protein EIN_331230 [Entamoeba invadens IP1]
MSHQIDSFSMQIILFYFNEPADFLSLIQVCKKFVFLLDRFRINPIRITQHTVKLFPNIQTQQIFTPIDLKVKVDRTKTLYPVSYDTYETKTTPFDTFRTIKYTNDDFKIYGQPIPEVVSQLDISALASAQITHLEISSRLTLIRENSFENNLFTKLELPSTLVNICKSAFSNNKKLKEVVLPNTITVLPDAIFSGCKLLDKINIPKSLKLIGSKAFSYTGLPSFEVLENFTVGTSVFEGCKYLTKITFSGQSIVPRNLCMSCVRLKRVKFDDSITVISDDAFNCCSSLEDFVIPKNLRTIGNKAFYECTSLKILNFSEKVCYVGEAAFCGCESLEKLIFENEKVVFGGVGVF